MELIHDTPFEFGRLAGRASHAHPSMLLVMKATFDLEHGAVAKLAEAQVPCTGPLYHDDDPARSLRYASDFAWVKPRGEYHLLGTCHPPETEPVAISGVAFQVGALQKSIGVYGDRVWKRGVLGVKPSAPAPFVSMPLTWERCFGGVGHAENPVGVGKRAIEGVHRLPNLENPQRIQQSPDEVLPPVGCGPISMTWPARQRFAGTYDARYQETRFPYYPDDFDPAYFQAAPEDQRIDGYWKGTEHIVLLNLRPGQPRLETRLPGIVARAFIQRSGIERLEEIPLHLDTIVVDADACQASCVFRGQTKVKDDRMSGIETLFLMDELLSDPSNEEACAHRLREARKREAAHLQGGAESPPSIHNPKAPPETSPTRPTLFYPPNQQWAEEDAERATAPNTGLPASIAGLPKLHDDEERATKLQAVPTGIAALGDDDRATKLRMEALTEDASSEPGTTSVLPKLSDDDEDVATKTLEALQEDDDLMQKLIADMKNAGIDVSLVIPQGLDALESGEPAGNAEPPNPAKIREAFQSMNQEVPDDIEDLIGEIENADQTLEECRYHPPAPPDTIPAKERALRAYREGKPLSGDLSEVDLSGEELPGIIAGSAILTGATFEGCNLEGANFDGATAGRVNFGRARLEGASFKEADLADADFSEAMLDHASLDQAVAPSACFKSASLKHASLIEVEFTECNLEGANLSHANCTEADFSQSRLHGVIAHSGNFEETRLLDVHAKRIDFTDATLTNLRASGSGDFSGAIFRGARGDGCRFRVANLHGSNFSFAALNDADFSGANMESAILDGCSLKNARFVETHLAHTQIARSDVMTGSFLDANLTDADLRGSNFFGAEFWRAITTRTKLDLANLKSTKLEGRGEP